jgi:hypothetical protein
MQIQYIVTVTVPDNLDPDIENNLLGEVPDAVEKLTFGEPLNSEVMKIECERHYA